MSAKKRRRCRRLVLRLIFLGFVGLGLFAGFEWLTWPDVGALTNTNPGTSAFIEQYKRRQGTAGLPAGVTLSWTPYGRISDNLKRAVLVSEDINFFSHDGFELPELEQAMRQAIRDRRAPRGASTITQQLAKNLWLSPSRNPWRKMKEAQLTRHLEEHLDKRRILEIYLNVVELGPGIYGAEAASRHYFNKPASKLSVAEAAQLAASLPRPRSWNPKSTSQTYRRRVDRLVGRVNRALWLRKII